LAIPVPFHVIDAPFHIGHGNRLHQLQRLRVLRKRCRRRAKEKRNCYSKEKKPSSGMAPERTKI